MTVKCYIQEIQVKHINREMTVIKGQNDTYKGTQNQKKAGRIKSVLHRKNSIGNSIFRDLKAH